MTTSRPSLVDVLLLALVCRSSAVGEISLEDPCGDDQPSTIIHDGEKQSDGSMIAGDGKRFPPGCYWSTLVASDNSTLVRGCDSDVTCTWKCCPRGQVLDVDSYRCVVVTHNNNNQTTSRVTRFDLSKFHLLVGNSCLDERFELDDEHIADVDVDDGVLTEKRDRRRSRKLTYPPGGYCLDHFQNGTSLDMVAFVCYGVEGAVTLTTDDSRESVTFVIYTVARIIALPFLIATVAVYAVIPELRNLHGKCLMSHVTSLSIAYVFLNVIIIGNQALAEWFCVASALMVYFFLLGSFFWLNVMCFDIWWTFSGYRPPTGAKGANNQVFMFYSLYAWGAPVVMLCVSVILDFEPNVPESYIRPEFGVYKCWFKDKVTVLAYFSGPVAVLIASNIVFFAITAYNILKIKKQTSVLSNSDSRRNDNNKNNEQQFVLYLKLFVVMGVTWALDQIGWAIGGPDYIWWVTDLANILQGVLVFVIFVWKGKVLKLLRKKFRWLPQSRNSVSASVSPSASTAVMMTNAN